MKKYIFATFLLVCALLIQPTDTRAENFKIGDTVEIIQDITCLDYSALRGDDKVAGDNCIAPSSPLSDGAKVVIHSGPRSGTQGNEYEVDAGLKDSYSYSANYGKPIYFWLPEKNLRSLSTPRQTVGSVTVSSSSTNIMGNSTLPIIRAKIVDATGQPVRGYTAKWSFKAGGTANCALVGYGRSDVIPGPGESIIQPYCVDYNQNINSPADGIIFTVQSGGKTASVTMYLSAYGNKGADGAIMPNATTPPPSNTPPPTSNVPGCQAGFLFSSTTGAPCNGGSNVPGCQPGFIFSPTTGQPCNGGSGTGGPYPIVCTNNGAGPSVTLCANRNSVAIGQSVILTWASSGLVSGANSCSIKNELGVSVGRSSLDVSNSGGVNSASLSAGTHTFTITCDSGTSFVRSSVSVTAGGTPPQNPPATPPGGTPPQNPTPPPGPTLELQVGANIIVRTEGALNVRATPSTSGALIGTQQPNATGIIIAGPVSANGYIWWKIRYANLMEGWSAGSYLIAISITTPPAGTPPATPPPVTVDCPPAPAICSGLRGSDFTMDLSVRSPATASWTARNTAPGLSQEQIYVVNIPDGSNSATVNIATEVNTRCNLVSPEGPVDALSRSHSFTFSRGSTSSFPQIMCSSAKSDNRVLLEISAGSCAVGEFEVTSPKNGDVIRPDASKGLNALGIDVVIKTLSSHGYIGRVWGGIPAVDNSNQYADDNGSGSINFVPSGNHPVGSSYTFYVTADRVEDGLSGVRDCPLCKPVLYRCGPQAVTVKFAKPLICEQPKPAAYTRQCAAPTYTPPDPRNPWNGGESYQQYILRAHNELYRFMFPESSNATSGGRSVTDQVQSALNCATPAFDSSSYTAAKAVVWWDTLSTWSSSSEAQGVMKILDYAVTCE